MLERYYEFDNIVEMTYFFHENRVVITVREVTADLLELGAHGVHDESLGV